MYNLNLPITKKWVSKCGENFSKAKILYQGKVW